MKAPELKPGRSITVGSTAVTLAGTKYNGLGFRLPKSFDTVARFQNSTGDKEKNGFALRAKWSSVSGPINDGAALVALFGRPANCGGDPGFFSMNEPFAYLSATQFLDVQPLQYARGDKFNLRYLLVVHGEPKSVGDLKARYQRWETRGQ